MSVIDVTWPRLLIGYAMLIFPLAVILWLRIGVARQLTIAVVRMTVQLLFVGVYLQVVFKVNDARLNALWLLAMVGVADISIVRGCGLRLLRLGWPLLVALVTGLAIPLLALLGPILGRPQLLDAQYAIPMGGMILGNCLRADIVGMKAFYQSIRQGERAYTAALAQGATLSEAIRPYYRDACRSAMAPTIASMATIGLVSLPGMMTGVILGGANPMAAIKYQILIMLGILTGTAITVTLAIALTTRSCFTPYGLLDKGIFRKD